MSLAFTTAGVLMQGIRTRIERHRYQQYAANKVNKSLITCKLFIKPAFREKIYMSSVSATPSLGKKALVWGGLAVVLHEFLSQYSDESLPGDAGLQTDPSYGAAFLCVS
jgi:hypothetical protein